MMGSEAGDGVGRGLDAAVARVLGWVEKDTKRGYLPWESPSGYGRLLPEPYSTDWAAAQAVWDWLRARMGEVEAAYRAEGGSSKGLPTLRLDACEGIYSCGYVFEDTSCSHEEGVYLTAEGDTAAEAIARCALNVARVLRGEEP